MQSWVFKGLDGEDPGLYYALAAAYGLPWVFHNLQLDGFTGLMLILGAIHVQVRLQIAPGSSNDAVLSACLGIDTACDSTAD